MTTSQYIDNSPGKVVILEADIYNSTSSVRYSVKKNLIAVDIYEDIYTPFVYCDIAVVDFNKIATKIAFVGEEFFKISFRTKDSKVVSYLFHLYIHDNATIEGNLSSAQTYMLRGVTLERSFDAAKTVSRSYKGSLSNIAGQIFEDYMKKDTGLEFNYEQSKSVTRYIVPQLSPLEAIEYCRAHAVPNSNVYSPFTFFRNSDGYHFISLNGLYNKSGSEIDKAVHILSNVSPDPSLTQLSESGGVIIKQDIKNIEPAMRHDSVSKISEGAYNNHSYSFDLTTKQYVLRRNFDLHEHINKFQLGNGNQNQINTSKFMRSFSNSRAHVIYQPVDFSIELDGTQPNFRPDAIGEMKAYASLVSQQQVNLVLYGDSNMTAGQVLAIKVYEPTDINISKKTDKQMSGTYLISRMRHNLTFDTETTYEIHALGMKGASYGSVEEIQSDE